MIMHHARALAAAAFVAPGLLITACSSGGSAATHDAATHTVTSAADSTGPAISADSSAQSSARQSGAGSSAASTRASTAHPARSSACALVTEKDVFTAQGADPGKGSAFSSHGATQCQYGSYATRVVFVNVLPARGAVTFDHLFITRKADAVPLSGLGDEALERSDGHSDTIYFTEGDTLVFIGISSQTAPRKGMALALAKVAAGHF